ncbi:MAG: hypothetical protein H6R07_3280 [Proteobacteria bacterium]|nr:hypothetical protein [Pseudomonadota bacterium]
MLMNVYPEWRTPTMVPCPATPHIDLDRLVHMIAHTVDLVGMDDYYHGRRVSLIAVQLGRALGFAGPWLQFIQHAGLLHDCGVSSTRTHRRLLNAIEWDGAQAHCIAGHKLLKDFAPLASLAPIILYHHTRWNELQAADLPRETAILANLIYLADRIDILSAAFYDDNILLSKIHTIRDILGHYRGAIFAPQLIDAFMESSAAEAFWTPLMSPEMVQASQNNLSRLYDSPQLEWPDIMQAADILAQIVDAKSPYTHRHSSGVANLSAWLAGEMGFATSHCEMIKVAGLLHDIGKLRIDDAILEAPRALTELEQGKMRTHSFMTYNILHEIGELETIAHWASQHHERLDGQGYPFRLKGDNLSTESRIICVADVYQALAQKRPYRDSLVTSEIFAIIDGMVGDGKLDGDIVAIAKAQPHEANLAALA